MPLPVSWPLATAGFSPANAGAARLRTVAAARPRAARRTPFPYDLVITFLHLGVDRARSGGTGNHTGQRSRNGESKAKERLVQGKAYEMLHLGALFLPLFVPLSAAQPSR